MFLLVVCSLFSFCLLFGGFVAFSFVRLFVPIVR